MEGTMKINGVLKRYWKKWDEVYTLVAFRG